MTKDLKLHWNKNFNAYTLKCINTGLIKSCIMVKQLCDSMTFLLFISNVLFLSFFLSFPFSFFFRNSSLKTHKNVNYEKKKPARIPNFSSSKTNIFKFCFSTNFQKHPHSNKPLKTPFLQLPSSITQSVATAASHLLLLIRHVIPHRSRIWVCSAHLHTSRWTLVLALHAIRPVSWQWPLPRSLWLLEGQLDCREGCHPESL